MNNFQSNRFKRVSKTATKKRSNYNQSIERTSEVEAVCASAHLVEAVESFNKTDFTL